MLQVPTGKAPRRVLPTSDDVRRALRQVQILYADGRADELRGEGSDVPGIRQDEERQPYPQGAGAGLVQGGGVEVAGASGSGAIGGERRETRGNQEAAVLGVRREGGSASPGLLETARRGLAMQNSPQTSTRNHATRGVDRCPVCGRQDKRSNEQSRRYWKIVYRVADEYKPDGRQFAPQTWHLQFRSYWLGCDEVRLPSGETIAVPRSTTDLDVDEFSNFMTAVEAWANARGVYLDDGE